MVAINTIPLSKLPSSLPNLYNFIFLISAPLSALVISKASSYQYIEPYFLEAAKQDKMVSLPPVTADSRTTSKGKSNSAPVQYPHPPEDAKNKPTNRRVLNKSADPRQFTAKAIQNFSFDQPGISHTILLLKRASDVKTKHNQNKDLSVENVPSCSVTLRQNF